MTNVFVSIVVLTFNRPQEIRRNVTELLEIRYENIELIVVDNNSEESVAALFEDEPRVNVLTMEKNIGVGARNHGLRKATGELVITLDDDVFGMQDESIHRIIKLFREEPFLGAVNFKVIDDVTEEQINWIHHREMEKFSEVSFHTYEISEGAAAFRFNALRETDLYPEYYFISHEGPDLAYQLIKASYNVIYHPCITVRHSHAVAGRKNWRRYYYDTRNSLWLVYRHLPATMAIKYLFIAWSSMLVYAIRDGYLKYWIQGVWSGLSGLRNMAGQREPLAGSALLHVKRIRSANPGFWYMVKKRISEKTVGI